MATKQLSKRGVVEPTVKEKAASKIAAIIEQHMCDLGLSEEEKNLRSARFVRRVDAAIENRAKS